MPGKGSMKHRDWVNCSLGDLRVIAADGGNGAEAVQVKIQRAQMLLEKINLEVSIIFRNLRINERNLHRLQYKLNYLTHWRSSENYDNHTDWIMIHIKDLKQAMEEKYYEYHGRAIEKHLLIREQDDIIRNSRRNMVHQRNSLAGERRLIKDLRLAEDTRAKIIVSGITNNSSNYEEDKKNIEALRAELVQRRVPLKEKKAQIDELEKKVELWEKELMKIYNLKEKLKSSYIFRRCSDATVP